MVLIYKATNKVNGKIYIGRTSTCISRRKAGHKNSSKTVDTPFYRAIRKYGWDNFSWETIETVDGYVAGIEREAYWIQHLRTNVPGTGYNCKIETSGGVEFWSDYSRQKMSITAKQKWRSLPKKEQQRRCRILAKCVRDTKIDRIKSAHKSNCKLLNRTGYIGVSIDNNTKKYWAAITFNGKTYYKYGFNTPVKAAIAFDKMAFYLLGDNTRLNFPHRTIRYKTQDLKRFFVYYSLSWQRQKTVKKHLDVIPITS